MNARNLVVGEGTFGCPLTHIRRESEEIQVGQLGILQKVVDLKPQWQGRAGIEDKAGGQTPCLGRFEGIKIDSHCFFNAVVVGDHEPQTG